MSIFVKDEFDEIINKLTEVVHVLNKNEYLKVYDILVPVLLIVTGETTYLLNQMNRDINRPSREDDTIYRNFINLKQKQQDKIINYIIKDIKNKEFIKLNPTKDIILSYIADEFHITIDAVDQKLEMDYLLFFTTFIVLFYKSIFYHWFNDIELSDDFNEEYNLVKKILAIKKELSLFIFLANKHKRSVN